MSEIRVFNGIVQFNKNNGPVSIEVSSGYSSLGNFRLSYVKNGNFKFIEFGDEPKRIDDFIPDIFQIPIALDELKDHTITIVGKYAPAPGKQQIQVVYQFIQQTEELIITPPSSGIIQENSNGDFYRYTHYFSFEEV